MEQLEFFPVVSPCIGLCKSGLHGYCEGCFRNRNERFEWNKFDNVEKHRVIRLCKQRKAIWLRKKRLANIEIDDENRQFSLFPKQKNAN